MIAPPPTAITESKKRSSRSKARMLREIRSYIAEFEDDSEEVKEEAEKLIDALEKRKKVCKKETAATPRTMVGRVMKRNPTPKNTKAQVQEEPVDEDEFQTPRKVCPAAGSGEGMIEYALTQSRALSALKAAEVRKICDQEGVVYVVKDQAVADIVRCLRDLAVKIISLSVKDEAVRSLVIERFRLVRLKGRAVGSIIHNYREVLTQRRDQCTCSPFHLERHQGHVRVRLDDVPGVHRFVQNSRNVTAGRTLTGYQLMEWVVKSIPKAWRKQVLSITQEEISCCFAPAEPRVSALTELEVVWEIQHLEGLVLVPLDRNPGATLVICPVLYFHAFRMAFCWNPGFLRMKEREDQILSVARDAYKNAGLQVTGTWRTCGKLGRAYVIPKDKDHARWRSISPSWSEPSRTTDARLVKALRYMLLCLPACSHFGLRATDFMKQAMTKAVTKLEKAGDTVIGRSFDIKDMFAKLPHDDIITSVVWLVHKMMGRGLVAVKVFGIPMGKHLSPSIANLLCAKAEFDFLSLLGNDRRMISGVRMVDDVSVLVVFDSLDRCSYKRVADIVESFERCYPSSLKLVRKDGGFNAWDFLGSRVVMEPCPPVVHIFPKTKNQ
ncbi:hypothetical protein CBR_g17570 [Chara braunii]|uniref:Reverse transcriptase domain-containing protein n=1 Tax=Chara braunii TaxID=69332 RepID=A0A388KUY7_CHABU|nr:hypothetical protein CBR_g17570 [Chara braunii]|eukprot:GBG73859.1 hypothetical protein CBR_g17570 [Chara braunii]